MFDTGSVKKRLAAGEATFGGWLSTNSVACAEVMAYAGYDWIGVDVEHSSASAADVERIAQVVKRHGAKPLVRVFDSSAASIRRMLDAGAEGVIVPMIRSVEEARQVVAAAKYPPQGRRGAGVAAANLYGATLGDYIAQANSATLVMLMVETREAVEHIDELLDIDGVDGIFLGPLDLSASYGIMGKTGDPVITAAIDRVFAACKAHGKAAGIHAIQNDSAALKSVVEKGATFVALSYDSNFLYQGSVAILDTARKAVPGRR